MLLLGKESDTGQWAGFGGLQERGESLQQTALREAYEESMGLLDERTLRQSTLQPFKFGNSMTISAQIPFDPALPLRFHQFYHYTKQLHSWAPEGWFEKDAVRWVPLRELRQLPLRQYMLEQLPVILPEIWNQQNARSSRARAASGSSLSRRSFA